MLKKLIAGGVTTLIIGGTGYGISQTSVVDNFAHNTGLSKEQAQTYVDNSKDNLASFSKIGQDLITDGNTITSTVSQIDCTNYTYEWESNGLSCIEGSSELQTIGSNEVALGNCYSALDTNLDGGSRNKISECIEDIDTTNASYDLPITSKLLSASEVSEFKNSNIYNKSVLQAALQSN